MRDFAKLQSPAGPARFQRRLTIVLAVGIVFGWLGPFDTNELPLFTALGFWTSMCTLWVVIASTTQFAASRAFPRWHRIGRWQRLAIIVVLSAPIGALVAGVALDALNRWEPSLLEALDLLSETMVVGTALEIIAAATLTVEDHHGSRPSVPDLIPAVAVSTESQSRQSGDGETPSSMSTERTCFDASHQEDEAVAPLLKRLSPSGSRTVLCLEMEDHYVRVHTEHGSSLVLMRLKDAMAELGGVDGLQVHRSWWVARDAIRSFNRSGRTVNLLLSNGLTVPVSQPYVAAVTRAMPIPA